MKANWAAIREQIRRLEGFAPPGRIETVSTGDAVLDALLPGGLARGAVHEILAEDPPGGAATGLMADWLARFAAAAPGRSVLWASLRGDAFAPGLAAAGLDPGRVLFAQAARAVDLLWALEEALREPGLAAVAGEIGAVDLTASRRLQLAAAGSATPLLLLRPARYARDPSAAATRWRVAAAPQGRRLELLRCRGAPAVVAHRGEGCAIPPAISLAFGSG